MYNAASYIKECITSLQNQSFSNFEIIIVDDGSTDNSYDICEREVLNDSRIKLFHQENMGVSSARAYGVKESQGEYIFFVDADDTVKADALEILYVKIQEGYDLVVSECSFEGEYSGCNFVRFILEQKIPVSIWGKLIKRRFLTEKTMFIPPYINVGEDLALNLIYNYRYNPNSVMANRKVSLVYEIKFHELITDILKNQMQCYLNSYRYLQLSSLEGLILSKAVIDYSCVWIQDLLRNANKVDLTKRQWVILHVHNPLICRCILLLGSRIYSIIRYRK